MKKNSWNKNKWNKKMVALIVTVTVCASGVPMEALAHGTTNQIITEDMVNNTPPEDYVIHAEMQAEPKDDLYNAYFLKDSIQTVSVTMEENNLNYLLQNAIEEPSVMTQSVTIGDAQIGYAGMKTKGNFTLAATNDSDSDRFSFTLNFGKYITKKKYGAKQNFYGLGKVSFNNLYFDKTAMKEYCALRLMDEMGVPTPEYGIAKLYINEQYYGVYFMVEAMDSSIVEQHLDTSDVSDYLTKAVGTNFAYDHALDQYKNGDGTFTMDSLNSVLYENADGDYVAEGKLLNSSGLWENDNDTLQDVAETLPTVLTWQEKLNLLSEGKDFSGNAIDVNSDTYVELLNQVMDVDETLRYFATHSFIIQQDNMFTNYQNFAIYVDNQGKSMLIPWDYDLGWGCYNDPFHAEQMANFDIDCMYSVYFHDYRTKTPTEVYQNFPLVNVLCQNETLWDKYHGYMEDCAKIASIGGTTTDGRTFDAGRFAYTIDILTSQLMEAASETLADNVYYLNGAKQPEDMTAGLPVLKNLIAMRSVGVWLQTNGMDTIVTGNGADMAHVGNALTGSYSVGGTLTVSNAQTGIFATATYPKEGSQGPLLDVQRAGISSQIFQTIKGKLGCVSDDDLIVYKMSDAKEADSLYQLYIPVSEQFATEDTCLYTYQDGILTKLVTTTDDNLYKGKTDNISWVVVAKNVNPAEGNVVTQSEEQANTVIEKVDVNSVIVGTQDMTTGWWNSFSEHYELPKNSVATLEFENHSAGVNYWDNFVSVYTNEPATVGGERSQSYKEYIVVRADNEGWGLNSQYLSYSQTYESEEDRLEILKDANVLMTITRSGNNVTVQERVTSLTDETKSYERTVKFKTTDRTVYLTMTVEGGYLVMKDVDVTVPSQSTGDNETGTGDNGGTDNETGTGDNGGTDNGTGSKDKGGTNTGNDTGTNNGTGSNNNTQNNNITKQNSSETSVNQVKKPKVAKVKKLKAKAGKKKITLTWKKVKGAKGYQIQISTKKDFKNAKNIKVKKNKTKHVVKKLKANKKYYIRIRAYKTYKTADGKTKKMYGKYVKITKKTK